MEVQGGYITKQGIEKKGDKSPWKFGIGVGNKQFVNCVCWHDDLLTGFNAGDEVLVFGSSADREYNGKTYSF